MDQTIITTIMKIIIEVKVIESENASVQLAFICVIVCVGFDFVNFFFVFFLPKGGNHNPYNGVVCNDTILATGVFSSKELWKLAKGASLCKYETINCSFLYNIPMANSCRLQKSLFFL